MIFFNLRLLAHNLFLDRILIDYKKKKWLERYFSNFDSSERSSIRRIREH